RLSGSYPKPRFALAEARGARPSGRRRSSAGSVADSRHALGNPIAGDCRSVAEQSQYGEDAAVVVLGAREPELLEDRLYVALDCARAQEQLLTDRAVGAPLGDEREYVPLPVGELVEHRAAVTADEGLHDLGIERGASFGHALDGVDELPHVAHAILQEIADARGVVADQLE